MLVLQGGLLLGFGEGQGDVSWETGQWLVTPDPVLHFKTVQCLLCLSHT